MVQPVLEFIGSELVLFISLACVASMLCVLSVVTRRARRDRYRRILAVDKAAYEVFGRYVSGPEREEWRKRVGAVVEDEHDDLDLSPIERFIRHRFASVLIREIYENGALASGLLPASDECWKIVDQYGDDMWEMLGEVDGYEGVLDVIVRAYPYGMESYGEFCLGFVAATMDDVARRFADDHGWSDEVDLEEIEE